MGHQEIVDRLVMLKAVRDRFDEAYEELRRQYTEDELERSPFPKGDGSLYGEVSGVFSKPAKETVEQSFVVVDQDALMADGSEDFAEYLSTVWLPANIGRAAEDYFMAVGEVLDGCELETVVTPAQPKRFKYMMVKPTKEAREAVAEMLAPQLAGLLEG